MSCGIEMLPQAGVENVHLLLSAIIPSQDHKICSSCSAARSRRQSTGQGIDKSDILYLWLFKFFCNSARAMAKVCNCSSKSNAS